MRRNPNAAPRRGMVGLSRAREARFETGRYGYVLISGVGHCSDTAERHEYDNASH